MGTQQVTQIKQINLIKMTRNNRSNPTSQRNSTVALDCLNRIKLNTALEQEDLSNSKTSPQTPLPAPLKSARSISKARPSLGFRRLSKDIRIVACALSNVNANKHKDIIIKEKKNIHLADASLIDDCLMKHFFMKSLSKHSRQEIIKEMSLAYVKANTIIEHQGTSGSYFYIIKSGTVELVVNNQRKKYHGGQSFGEISLLHDTTLTGNTVALTECFLWLMERKVFKKILDHITMQRFEENKSFIESIPLLSNMEHFQKTIIASSLYKNVYEKGTVIVSKGDKANCLYIIKEGEVDCMQDNVCIRTLKRGENFGERSILIESQRTLDVIARTNCVCYSISTVNLKELLGENYRTLLYLNFAKHVIDNSKYFSRFHYDQIEKVFDLFEAVNLTDENVAFPIGHLKSSKIVIVIDGNLINDDKGEIVAQRSSILFEEDLVNNTKEMTTYRIIPEPDCLFLEADAGQMLSRIGCSFKDRMNQCEIINSLSKVVIFCNIPLKKLELISQKIHIEHFKKNEIIVNEGDTGDKFYMIKEGSVNVSVKDEYLRTLNAKEYFGERALLTQEPRSASVKATIDTELYSLTKEDFLSNIESTMKEYLDNSLKLQDNLIELEDLVYYNNIGFGSYGSVSHVKNKKNGWSYAIKAIPRKQIDHLQLHQNLSLEKALLLKIDHPFIMKLVKCLKDSNFIYYLMEYVKGQELYEVMREIGLLSKEQTQFYGASMIKVIEYLHERKIIYRDIKPENIVVKENGFIKMIDFGTAKQITDRTNTIIGTPHYMAPEIILGNGYSFQVDYWSIGVCIYEFFCGSVPFGEADEDPMEIYYSIMEEQLAFPSFIKDREFKNLINSMLAKNPAHRMTRTSNIQNHLWFRGFNWNDLMSFNISPPHLPNGKSVDQFITNRKGKKNNGIPYCDFMRTKNKKYVPPKDSLIPSNLQLEYDNWYDEF